MARAFTNITGFPASVHMYATGASAKDRALKPHTDPYGMLSFSYFFFGGREEGERGREEYHP